jgi:N-acetylglucosaminyl-diphospho-decaprenol L-rhamnosyltransferase
MTEERQAAIDVVIATYNSASTLEACLMSLRKLSNARIFVIDNGSSDASVNIAKIAAPSATIIRSATNAGFGDAINRGVSAGHASMVLVLNPDAEIIADVEPVLEHVRVNDSIATSFMDDGVGRLRSNAFRFPTWGTVMKVSTAHIPVEQLQESSRDQGWAAVDYIEGSFFVVRRATWERLGGFSPDYFMYGEDRDLSRRARNIGVSTVVVRACVFSHQGGFSVRRQPWYVRGILLYTQRFTPRRLPAVWAILLVKFALKSLVSVAKGDRESRTANAATLREVLSWVRTKPDVNPIVSESQL